jgi:CRISPR type III-A-associated RAMP protein Csm4
MQIECWSIQGTSFHFGQHGIGQEETAVTLPSDSLFAALAARLARSQGAKAVEAFCRPFNEGRPPFVITSTFLRVGEVRFFPVPLRAKRGANTSNVDAKKLKKIEFVSEQIFKQLIAGTALEKL